jgi:hypothetical protein
MFVKHLGGVQGGSVCTGETVCPSRRNEHSRSGSSVRAGAENDSKNAQQTHFVVDDLLIRVHCHLLLAPLRSLSENVRSG